MPFSALVSRIMGISCKVPYTRLVVLSRYHLLDIDELRVDTVGVYMCFYSSATQKLDTAGCLLPSPKSRLPAGGIGNMAIGLLLLLPGSGKGTSVF